MATTVTDETRRSSLLFGATTILVVATTCVVSDQRGLLPTDQASSPTAFLAAAPLPADVAAPAGSGDGVGDGAGHHRRGHGGSGKAVKDYAAGLDKPASESGGTADGSPNGQALAFTDTNQPGVPAPAQPGVLGDPGRTPDSVGDVLNPGNPAPPVVTDGGGINPGGGGTDNPTPVPPAPEPGVWALMLLGLGLIGGLQLRGRFRRA